MAKYTERESIDQIVQHAERVYEAADRFYRAVDGGDWLAAHESVRGLEWHALNGRKLAQALRDGDLLTVSPGEVKQRREELRRDAMLAPGCC